MSNSKLGGMTCESIKDYIKTNKDAKILVSVVFLKDRDYRKLETYFDNYINNVKNTTYDYSNLINILKNKALPNDHSLSSVCSQFVDSLFKWIGADITDKPSNLVTPQDIADIRHPRVYKLYEGLAIKYNSVYVSILVDKLQKYNGMPIKEAFNNNFTVLNIASNRKKAAEYLKTRNSTYTKYIDNYCGELIIDKNTDKLAAQVLVGAVGKDKSFITGLEVYDPYKGNGIGSKLTRDAIVKYGGIDLTVFKDNKIALDLYKKNGFVIIGDGNCKGKDYHMKLRNKLNKDDKIIKEQVLDEAKEFPVQFNDEGDLLIKKKEKIDFQSECNKSKKLRPNYVKYNNLEGLKYECCKLWYMNVILLKLLDNKDLSDSDREDLNLYRSKVLTEFPLYLKEIQKIDKNFNFSYYYENTPFSNTKVKIKGSTIKYSLDLLRKIFI